MGLGISLFNRNRVEEGLEAMVKATLSAPQVSAYQSYLAKAYFELGRHDDSLRALERARRLGPKDPTPYLYEALILYALHRPGEAAGRLEQARRLRSCLEKNIKALLACKLLEKSLTHPGLRPPLSRGEFMDDGAFSTGDYGIN